MNWLYKQTSTWFLWSPSYLPTVGGKRASGRLYKCTIPTALHIYTSNKCLSITTSPGKRLETRQTAKHIYVTFPLHADSLCAQYSPLSVHAISKSFLTSLPVLIQKRKLNFKLEWGRELYHTQPTSTVIYKDRSLWRQQTTPYISSSQRGSRVKTTTFNPLTHCMLGRRVLHLSVHGSEAVNKE